jgi:hypothetical protein
LLPERGFVGFHENHFIASFSTIHREKLSKVGTVFSLFQLTIFPEVTGGPLYTPGQATTILEPLPPKNTWAQSNQSWPLIFERN